MAHALLAPSSAHRWLKCTPSARLAAMYENTNSTYAAEGTLAHWLGETLLKKDLGLITIQKYKKDIREIEKSEYYDKAMLEYCKDYRDYVLEQRNKLIKAKQGDVKIYIEKEVQLGEYIPSSFGTLDVFIHNDVTLVDIDLKFGKGVLVSPVANEQFMIYALGAKKLLWDDKIKIKDIELHVYQPRLNNIEAWKTTAIDLNKWYASNVMQQANLAYNGTGDYVAGDHCIFCPAKKNCKTFAEFNMSNIDENFSLPNSLDKEFISKVIINASLFEGWLKAVKEFALAEAQKGVKFPDLKIVAGRSNRIIKEPQTAALDLSLAGFEDNEIYKPQSLKTLTELEKTIGKSELAEILGDLIYKPDGAPTLVKSDDKRPEIGIGKVLNEFQDLFE